MQEIYCTVFVWFDTIWGRWPDGAGYMDFPDVLHELVDGIVSILSPEPPPRGIAEFNQAGCNWLSIPQLSPSIKQATPQGELFPVAPAYQAYGAVHQDGAGWL